MNPAPISLLIPARNAEAHLPALLGDIEAQHTRFGEVIFFDDHSSDHTAGLIAAAGHRLLRGHARLGPAAGRNLLLRASTLPWIHFHDADDRLNPRFASAFQHAITDHDPDGKHVWFCDSYREHPGINWSETTSYAHLPAGIDWLGYHLDHFISHIQMVFPRSILEQAGGYHEHLVSGEDVNLHIRIAAAGHAFRYLADVLMHQNCGTPGSLSASTTALRRKQDTLHSCIDLRPHLPPRYHAQLAKTVTMLARQFASLNRPSELDAALRELLVLGIDPREARRSGRIFSLLVALLGFPASCRLLRALKSAAGPRRDSRDAPSLP